MEFYADGELLAYALAPYTFDWTNVPAGQHEIYAIAYDDGGTFAGEEASTQSETVTVTLEANQNNQPPSVMITKSRDNQKVYRFWGTDFRVDASDPDGVVTKVEFYADGLLLYTDTIASYGFYWWPSSSGTQYYPPRLMMIVARSPPAIQ